MLHFIVRRLYQSLLLLFIMSMVIFAIITLPPGDFLTTRVAELERQGSQNAEAQLHGLRARYGMDKPIYMQYWLWTSHFVQGDFGESFDYNRPVSSLIGQSMLLTIVISIAFLITTFLIVKVVPVFGDIFADFGAKLPAPTQFLIDLSDFIRGQWYFLIAIIVGVFFGIRTFLRSKRGRQIWDKWKLKMPVFGPLAHKICMSRFARTFAQLIRSGVPILEVLDIVAGASGNHVIETSVKGVAEDVEKGDNLSVAMSKKPIFPPMMLRMVSAGEATGKIDTMLEKMADFWDEEIEAMLDALTSLIEPMLIVFLGVIVGGIVIAMFLPIFKLNEIVSQSKS